MVDGVNPSGPVFVSYRWSDGSGHATDLAGRLRASGVPVWLDRDDMPPGETSTRLKEALASGLSGAVFVATEDIQPRKLSDAIHDIEVPALLKLDQDPRFTLAVLGTIGRPGRPDRIDRDRTEQLYGRPEMKGLKHYGSPDGTVDTIGRAFAKERLRHLRPARSGPLTIDIQTRRASTAFASTSDLVFRTVPPTEGRVPARHVWEDLQGFLAWLPTAVADERAPEVALVGGAHLSAAFAFGATLPETAGIPMGVRATDKATWRHTTAGLNWHERLPIIGFMPKVEQSWRGDGSALAIFVDLVPTKAPATFEGYLNAHRDSYGAGIVIDSNRRLGANDGPRLIAELAGLVRRLAARHDNAVHLFLRTPWAGAALLGASLNTVAATLYEWDNTVSPPDYAKTISVNAGVGGGPITSVHMA